MGSSQVRGARDVGLGKPGIRSQRKGGKTRKGGHRPAHANQDDEGCERGRLPGHDDPRPHKGPPKHKKEPQGEGHEDLLSLLIHALYSPHHGSVRAPEGKTCSEDGQSRGTRHAVKVRSERGDDEDVIDKLEVAVRALGHLEFYKGRHSEPSQDRGLRPHALEIFRVKTKFLMPRRERAKCQSVAAWLGRGGRGRRPAQRSPSPLA